MPDVGDTIKLEAGDELQTHTITRTTSTSAYYSGGAIAINRLCRVGGFWLEMARPGSTTKTEGKPKSKRGQKLHFVEDGETWGNVPYCSQFIEGFRDQILHSWRQCGLVKGVRKGFWFFLVPDVKRARVLRDPIGRIVDGQQFYTTDEVRRRVGGNITCGCVGGWITRGHVETHRPKGAILVICWSDVVQHCKLIGREIENDSA